MNSAFIIFNYLGDSYFLINYEKDPLEHFSIKSWILTKLGQTKSSDVYFFNFQNSYNFQTWCDRQRLQHPPGK